MCGSQEEIEEKAVDLSRCKHKKAAEAGSLLVKKVGAYADAYAGNFTQKGYEKFCQDAMQAINDADVELQKHRGWKRMYTILGNLNYCYFLSRNILPPCNVNQ